MNWARVGPEPETEAELCQAEVAECFRLPWAALAAFPTLAQVWRDPVISLPDVRTPHLSEETPLPLSAAFQFLSPSKFSVTIPSLSSSPINFQHLRLQFLLITSPSFQFLPKSQNFLISKVGFPGNISRYFPFLHLP